MRCIDGITERGGRCYELTTRIMIEEEGADRWRLVHGRLRYGPGDIYPSCAHAWIDIGEGQIYDLHEGRLAFRDYRNALGVVVVDAVYTKAEVVSWVRLTGKHVPHTPLLRTEAATYAVIPCGS